MYKRNNSPIVHRYNVLMRDHPTQEQRLYGRGHSSQKVQGLKDANDDEQANDDDSLIGTIKSLILSISSVSESHNAFEF